MESKLKLLIKKRKSKFRSLGIDANINEDIRFASKFIEDSKLQKLNGIFYFFNKKLECWEELLSNGDKIDDIIKTKIQMFYSAMGFAQRSRIKNEVLLLMNDNDINPASPCLKHQLVFNNGYLDIEKFAFFEIKKELINSFPFRKFNFDYLNNKKMFGYMETLFNWWSLGKEDRKKLLLEIVGTVISGIPLERIFNFTGVGGSGKSLLISLIEDIVGSNFIASTSIASLGERFGTNRLINKKVLIESDAAERKIEPTWLKKITGNDTISIEFKARGFIQYKPDLNVVITSNETLRFFGSFEGINRRLVPLNFPYKALDFHKTHPELTNKFEPVKLKILNGVLRFRNENGHWEFKEEILQSVVFEALEAFHKLYINDFKFSTTKDTENFKDDMEQLSNPILYFLNDEFTFDWFGQDNISFFIKSGTLYKKYVDWAKDSRLSILTKSNFIHKIEKLISTKWGNKVNPSFIKKINGKNERVFIIHKKIEELITKIKEKPSE